jgi:hypothetical protein|eukprot:scaffold40962_cov562-Skeletonema_marinoi.AAC.2
MLIHTKCCRLGSIAWDVSKQFGLRIVRYSSHFGLDVYDVAAVDDLPIDAVYFAASVNVDKNNVREVMAFNYLLNSVTPPSEEDARPAQVVPPQYTIRGCRLFVV